MQRRRLLFQIGFFLLFLLAPALDLLRFDLNESQLWFLGQRWTLGIDDLRAGHIGAGQMSLQLLLRALLPALALLAIFLGVAWRYGRLYCGWLCPHFSLVELLNQVLQRACGKLSLWDKHASTRHGITPSKRWWPVYIALCLLFGFVWAITLLTYLLPPATIWGNLLADTLTPNQTRFLLIGTAVFTLEMALARHLFCRFGCAVGLFQSLVWMANPRGMVVAFRREQARDCRHCATDDFPQGSACDNGCPMRLHPRNIKRMMFSCVQCGQCLDACHTAQGQRQQAPLLEWRIGLDAVRENLRQSQSQSPRQSTAALPAHPPAQLPTRP